jgi:hypothetical protein
MFYIKNSVSQLNQSIPTISPFDHSLLLPILQWNLIENQLYSAHQVCVMLPSPLLFNQSTTIKTTIYDNNIKIP